MTICEKTCEITKSNVPISENLGTVYPQSVMEDKQFGPTTTWTARAQRAVHYQCALVCWEWLHQVRGQARPLLLTSDNTTGVVTTHSTVSNQYSTTISIVAEQ